MKQEVLGIFCTCVSLCSSLAEPPTPLTTITLSNEIKSCFLLIDERRSH